MKATTAKIITFNQHYQKSAVQAPFFQKNEEGAFFGGEQMQAKPDSGSFYGNSLANNSSTPFFSPLPIQAKLKVGQPGDKYEREADHMADTVVKQLANPVSTDVAANESPISSGGITATQAKCAECTQEEKIQKQDGEEELSMKGEEIQRKPIFESEGDAPVGVQRKCADCGKDISKPTLQTKSENQNNHPSSSLETRLGASKGKGQPLSKDTQTSMESSFDTDFSGVRVHTGSDAVQMSSDLGAQAFTHGSDIYFNKGKYDTGSSQGKHLLAHELTHTVQQGGVRSQQINKKEEDKVNLAKVEQDAKSLYKSMAGLGTNEKLLLNTLKGKSISHLKKVRKKYLSKYKEELEDEVKSELSGADYKMAMVYLLPAIPILDRLKLQKGFFDDNEEAMIEVVKTATKEDYEEARTNPKVRSFLKGELDHLQFYEVSKILWPDDMYMNVVTLIIYAKGLFSDDEEQVYMALLDLNHADRKKFWNRHRNFLDYFQGYTKDDTKIDPSSDYGVLQKICTGTEAQALEAAMYVATEGAGTYDDLVAHLSKKTGEALKLEAQIQQLLKKGMGQTGKPLTKKERAGLQSQLNQLGGIQSNLLKVQIEGGKLKLGSFIERFVGDLGQAEYEAYFKQMGVKNFDIAKVMIIQAPGFWNDDEAAIYRAFDLIPDAATRKKLYEDTDVQKALGISKGKNILSEGEMKTLGYYKDKNTYQIAVHKLKETKGFWSQDYAEFLNILLAMSKEDREKLKIEYARDFQLMWAFLDKSKAKAIDEVLRTGKLSTDTALDFATIGAGTEEDFINKTFDRMGMKERLTYRIGYALANGYKIPPSFMPIKKQKVALKKYNDLVARFPGELTFDERQDALDHLLGSPTLHEYTEKGGYEMIMFILNQRVIDKGSTRDGSFGDWFVDLFSNTGGTSDVVEVAARSMHIYSKADGKISDVELAAMAFLESEFKQKYQEYVQAADSIADLASTIGAIVAAVVVTIASAGTLGAPAVAALSGYLGVSSTAVVATAAGIAAGGTKLVISEAVGEEHFSVGQEGGQAFTAGFFEGVITALSAGIAKSLQAALFRGLQGAALTAELTVGVVRATEVTLGNLGKRVVAGGIRGAIEGIIAETSMGIVMTAMDEETWRKSLWDTIVRFGAAILRGVALGGAGGFIGGGVMESLSFVVGKARLNKLIIQLEKSGISATDLDKLTMVQASIVGKIDNAVQQGALDDAVKAWRKVAKELDPEYATKLRNGLFNMGKTVETTAQRSIDDIVDSVKRRILREGAEKFQLKYTDDEIRFMIGQGRKRGLNDSTIEDMIFVGARKDKMVKGQVVKKHLTPGEVVGQMDNYVNDVLLRGYPYLFDSAKKFAKFKADIIKLLNEAGVPVSDIRIQGSSLRNKAARDIDIAVFLDATEFKQLADNILERFKQRAELANTPKAWKNYRKYKQQVDSGRIASYPLNGANNKSFNQNLMDIAKLHGIDIDLSVMKRGASFELEPSLRFNQ